jgi:tRNA nucleotidyltransferase (CCA-adding enzyme)
MLDVIEQADYFRRPERFDLLLRSCECDARGREGFEDRAYPQAGRMRMAAQAAAQVDAGALAREGGEIATIKEKIRQARLAAIRAALR